MDRSWTTQVRKGLTEFSVLAALRNQEAYGYQLLQRLGQKGGEAGGGSGAAGPLATTPATLYPVLARLTDEGLIDVREQASPSGPPRRYYRLTAAGEKQLADMRSYWQELTAALDLLMKNNPGTS